MLALSALFRREVKSRDFSGGCGNFEAPLSVKPLDSQLDDKDLCSYVYTYNPASGCYIYTCFILFVHVQTVQADLFFVSNKHKSDQCYCSIFCSVVCTLSSTIVCMYFI